MKIDKIISNKLFQSFIVFSIFRAVYGLIIVLIAYFFSQKYNLAIYGSIPIFINQTTGYGHSYESFIVARTITNHCKKNKLTCLNLAKEINLEYEDFYDESHVNRSGP